MSTYPDGFEFRVPWHTTDKPLHEELLREVSKEHQLYGVDAKAVAHRQDCDDVLFELSGNSAPAAFAVVHLTWSGKPDLTPNFPETHLYSTFSDWIDRCMTPDAQDWELSEPGAVWTPPDLN